MTGYCLLLKAVEHTLSHSLEFPELTIPFQVHNKMNPAPRGLHNYFISRSAMSKLWGIDLA